MSNWKQMITGTYYNMDWPSPSFVRSRDISTGLAFTCRYGGQVNFFYSTAEHSVLMAEHFLDLGRPDLAKEALVHDAHEYATGDLHGPSKRRIQGYEGFERKHEWCVRAALGMSHAFDPLVKEADLRILLDERAALLPTPPAPWHVDHLNLEPLGVDIVGWYPGEVRRHFDKMAQKLGVTVNGEPWEAW